MQRRGRYQLVAKIWIEYEGRPLIGKGGAEILQGIREKNSLSEVVKKLGMSYRYAWNYLKKVNDATVDPVVATHKGGRLGGGNTKLTPLGEKLLNEYQRLEKRLGEILSGPANFAILDLNGS